MLVLGSGYVAKEYRDWEDALADAEQGRRAHELRNVTLEALGGALHRGDEDGSDFVDDGEALPSDFSL